MLQVAVRCFYDIAIYSIFENTLYFSEAKSTYEALLYAKNIFVKVEVQKKQLKNTSNGKNYLSNLL